MSDVQFETDNQVKVAMGTSMGIVRAENKMAEWLIRKGIAKNETQSQMILVGVAAVAFVIAVIIAGFILKPETPTGTEFPEAFPVSGAPTTPASNF